MSKIKLMICVLGASTFFFFNCSFSCAVSDSKQEFDYNENIEKHKEMLLKEPNNCLHLEQIASSYQALNDLNNAIIFYKRTLDNCPNKLLNKFQLGICYYLIMDRDNGIGYMNEAIEDAERENNSVMLEMFKREKKSWLEKWDSVHELEWNKNRVRSTHDP